MSSRCARPRYGEAVSTSPASAFFVPTGYPPVEESREWQLSRRIFSVTSYDDGSSYLEGMGFGSTHENAQRMYEAAAERGLMCG